MPKNKAAQALRKLAKPENMARSSDQARKAAEARWAHLPKRISKLGVTARKNSTSQ